MILLLLGVICALGIGAAFWSHRSTPPVVMNPIACTAEARMCPDGSYVSRVAPSCEFAACPTIIPTSTIELPPTSTSTVPPATTMPGWKTVTDLGQNITYAYPEAIATTYIHTQVWPPTVAVTPAIVACTTELHRVEDRAYCVHETSEGAAGSIYTEYAYTPVGGTQANTVMVKFTLRSVQCLNYDDPQQSVCLQERSTFSPDRLADSIVQTVHFGSERPRAAMTPSSVTLDGVYVCLPHRAGDVYTMECAFGMKVPETNRYYALDTQALQADALHGIETSSPIHVTGQMTPVEMLSTNQWQKYDIKGIVHVETLTLRK